MAYDTAEPKSYFSAVARGMQPAGVRQSNQRAVLTVISTEQGISNAGIARRTGLAPQTVSAVLADLESIGLLKRGDARRGGGRGQPARPIYVDPDGALALGAEIGWQRIEVVLVNVGARVVRRERRAYEQPDAGMVVDRLAQLVHEVTAPLNAAAKSRLAGLGVAAPTGTGESASAPPLPGLFRDAATLAAEASRVTGIADVQVMNDGNAACWAEFVAHPSPRPGNFLFVLVDTHLAAGIVAADRLLEGATGAAADLASIRVSGRDGASRAARELVSLDALRARLAADGLALSDAFNAAPPPAARKSVDLWIGDAGGALAETILAASAIADFDFAAIDGEIPPTLLLRLIERVRTNLEVLSGTGHRAPQVRAGHLNRSGAAQGAAFRQLYRRYFSRELTDLDA